MPCDLETTQAAACDSGIGKLDGEIQLLQAWAQTRADTLAALSPSTDVTLAAIQERACESGIGKLSNPIKLYQVIAQSLCGGLSAEFVEAAGITDQTQIAALDSLMVAAITNGWWDKCDLIYPFVGGTALAHSINLKAPGDFTITWNGTVTHDANGITGDGATGYGDTGYVPASSGQALLNSAAFSFYRRTLGVVGGFYLGARGSSVSHQLSSSHASPSTSLRLNDAGSAIASEALGFVGGSRTAAAIKFALVGGVIFSSTAASVTIPGVTLYIGANNQNGSTVSFSDANLSSVIVGSGLTETQMQLMASDWQTFQAALSRAV